MIKIHGLNSAIFLIIYSISRIIIEMFREPDFHIKFSIIQQIKEDLISRNIAFNDLDGIRVSFPISFLGSRNLLIAINSN